MTGTATAPPERQPAHRNTATPTGTMTGTDTGTDRHTRPDDDLTIKKAQKIKNIANCRHIVGVFWILKKLNNLFPVI